MSELNGYQKVPAVIRRYRDFWDVPRMMVVDYAGREFLFDCPFDDEREDYPGFYRVYSMPPLGEEQLDGIWAGLPKLAEAELGTIPLESLKFDATFRKRFHSREFEALIPPRPLAAAG